MMHPSIHDPSPLRYDKDRMLRSTIALTAVAVTCHLLVCVGAVVPTCEHGALVDMYNALDGPLWSNASGWGTDSASDPCAAGWFGVACNVDGSHVVGIDLISNGLIGSLPDSISALSALTGLYLTMNDVQSLPDSLYTLTRLQQLQVGMCGLAGSIPEAVGSLQSLQVLWLSYNSLVGTLPDSLGSLTNLVSLYLDNNYYLNGTLPSSLGNLKSLHHLTLGTNRFTGGIPDSFGNLQQLLQLKVSSNQVSGTVPDSFAGVVTAAGTHGSFDFSSNSPTLEPSQPVALACKKFGTCTF